MVKSGHRATCRQGWTLGLHMALLWSVVVVPPASTPGSPPQAWEKEAGELRRRKASPRPSSSPRPQFIPTLPPRRQWTGHRRRPGETGGVPTRTSSQPPPGLPRPLAKSFQTSKGMRAESCNQGQGYTPGGLDWPPIPEVSIEGKAGTTWDGWKGPGF